MENHGNIVHVLYSGIGGTNEYVFNLIKGDKQNAFNHHIIFYGVENVPGDNLKTARELGTSASVFIKKPGIDKRSTKDLNRTISGLQPLAILCHVNSLIPALVKLKTKQCQLLFVEHQANHLKSKKEWVWSFLAQKKADKVISFTEDYQVSLKKAMGLLYKKKKNRLIPTGVELDYYACERKFDRNPLKLGIVSRINEFRDHATLCEAFDTLENNIDCELLIAGNGPLKEELSLKYTDRITWLGVQGRDEIRDLLGEIDIYVIASFGESTSIALMQAQAAGLPIIGTKVSGINHILTSENSLQVEAGNVASYQKAISDLVSNQQKREELSAASKAYAKENLDNEEMFNGYKRLIL